MGQVPRFSPDGTLLAYRDIVEGRSKTFVVAAGGTAARALCEDCLVTGFFPGNEAALVRNKPNELEKMDLRTGEKRVVLSSPRDIVQDASLSPDGRWIAWLAGEPDGRAAVRISPVDSAPSEARETITVAQADIFSVQPDWSPNGRWLYYLSEKNGRCSIFARELDPRTKIPVGEEREILETTGEPALAELPLRERRDRRGRGQDRFRSRQHDREHLPGPAEEALSAAPAPARRHAGCVRAPAAFPRNP